MPGGRPGDFAGGLPDQSSVEKAFVYLILPLDSGDFLNEGRLPNSEVLIMTYGHSRAMHSLRQLRFTLTLTQSIDGKLLRLLRPRTIRFTPN